MDLPLEQVDARPLSNMGTLKQNHSKSSSPGAGMEEWVFWKHDRVLSPPGDKWGLGLPKDGLRGWILLRTRWRAGSTGTGWSLGIAKDQT